MSQQVQYTVKDQFGNGQGTTRENLTPSFKAFISGALKDDMDSLANSVITVRVWDTFTHILNTSAYDQVNGIWGRTMTQEHF